MKNITEKYPDDKDWITGTHGRIMCGDVSDSEIEKSIRELKAKVKPPKGYKLHHRHLHVLTTVEVKVQYGYERIRGAKEIARDRGESPKN